jgi:hypothetical protein
MDLKGSICLYSLEETVMRKRFSFLGLIALLSLVLYGCDLSDIGGAARPVTVQSKAAGLLPDWLRYESPDDGFTLDVPDSWLKFEVSGEDLEAGLKILTENNPGLAEYMDNIDFKRQLSGLARSGVRLILYDTSVDVYTTLFATNLNIIRVDVPDELKLDEVVDKNMEELKRALGSGLVGDIRIEPLKMAGVAARKIYYTYRIQLGYGPSLDADVTQYLLVKKGVQYILTFSTSSDEGPYRANDFDKIARTFKLPK